MPPGSKSFTEEDYAYPTPESKSDANVGAKRFNKKEVLKQNTLLNLKDAMAPIEENDENGSSQADGENEDYEHASLFFESNESESKESFTSESKELK